MKHNDYIQILQDLGEILRRYQRDGSPGSPCPGQFRSSLDQAVEKASLYNPWFTRDNILFALHTWGETLTRQNIESWLSRYPEPSANPLVTGIIAAGNIPLVGMHDIISTLVSGHIAQVKLSADDRFLLPAIADILTCLAPGLKPKIRFVSKLNRYDAVIATGSDNTARYFEYYFSHVPHIIRKNRNAVAVITGEETQEELSGIGEDVFRYFGMGCRSVSKVYVPAGYDLDRLFEIWYPYREIMHHNKYYNNYIYHKTLYLMNRIPLVENGFLLMKEDPAYASPVAVLHYEYYHSPATLKTRIQSDGEQIQCVVSHAGGWLRDVAFGKSQRPALWEYADGVDTVSFLTRIC